MNSEIPDSVTEWVRCLERGENQAAARLWERFFDRIVGLARKRLEGLPRRASDEEDVAASVFESLYRGAVEGRFAQVQDRDELWRLLAAITHQKSVDHYRHQVRLKRGGLTVRGDSVVSEEDGEERGVGFDALLGEDSDPAFLVQMEEERQRLFAGLRDDSLRAVVSLRLEGYTNREISERLQITERAVERKLQLIREKWQREMKP